MRCLRGRRDLREFERAAYSASRVESEISVCKKDFQSRGTSPNVSM
jgi:hypothetical protein